MSHKRYQYKMIEAVDTVEFESLLKQAASQQWSAVGYGILPDGRRSALMERKTKVHSHRQKARSHHHDEPPVVAHDE
jgi:hypothetical protein